MAEPTQLADTVVMRGEFIEVDRHGLRPYDVLGEGRVIVGLESGYSGPYRMRVAPVVAAVEVVELADGPRCLWRPVSDESHWEDVPSGTIRVFRGDLPGYFCTAEPDGPRDPCSSGRCPIRGAHSDGSGCAAVAGQSDD